MDQRRYATLLLIAAALGIPAALAAVLLTAGMHQLEHLLWHALPEAAGWSEPPSWLVVLIPAAGGLMVAASLRMRGHGGHPAADGLVTDPVPFEHLPSILLAAFGSISMGLVVGPEAPLVALGLVAGGVSATLLRQGEEDRAILGFAGAFATISTAFGGPLPSALLLLEVTALTGRFSAPQVVRLLLPGFLAAGTGALIFTGIGDWGGLAAYQLALPGLPAYPTVRVADLLWCLPVALVAGAASALTLAGGTALAARLQQRPPTAVLIGGGAAVGLIAVVARWAADAPVDQVLFSGSSALGPLISETSATILGAVLVAKCLAFALTIAAGFRGGLIFPAVTLGVVIGLVSHHTLGGPDITPAVIAGIAAAAGGMLRAPFFGALMATLLAGAVAPDLAPIAVVASVVGWLAAMPVHLASEPEDDHRQRGTERQASPAAPSSDQA